ncbi:MAG: radical SAM protein [Anaerolineaceae bacterium]
MLYSCLWKDQRLGLSLKSGCLTLSLEKVDEVLVYSFDFAGRLWTSLEENKSFRHGLDGRTLARWKDQTGRQRREWLSEKEAHAIESRAMELAYGIFSEITAGMLALQPPLSEGDMTRLRKAANYGSEQLLVDRQEFNRIYRPIGILPPDQYMSVVLQLTEGCSFNSCTFCSFYKGQEFRVKNPEEFYRHALDVRDYLREGISLRKTIFLGGANALVLPFEKLKPYLEIIHQLYDVKTLGGIYAFLDGFSGEKKSPADFQEMADLGMDTIYIGLESGCNELLEFLNKPATAEQVLDTVKAAKSAGIAAAVIILLGAGGQAYSREHVRETVRVLNDMNLDAGDMIYFSKMINAEDSPYGALESENHLVPLSEREQEDQWQSIESQLNFDQALGTPSISVYDIRDFIF